MKASFALVLPAVLTFAASLGACSQSSGGAADGGSTCPNDLPATCPMPTPSYQTDVVPIIQARCYPCHGPGGVEQRSHDFSNYAGVYMDRSAILTQVFDCLMPMGSMPLTIQERVTLLGWLKCDAPNN